LSRNELNSAAWKKDQQQYLNVPITEPEIKKEDEKYESKTVAIHKEIKML